MHVGAPLPPGHLEGQRRGRGGAAIPAAAAEPAGYSQRLRPGLWSTLSHSKPAKPGLRILLGHSPHSGHTGEAGWAAAGVVIGDGTCYCVYRLTWERVDRDYNNDDEDESSDTTEIGVETWKEANTWVGPS